MIYSEHSTFRKEWDFLLIKYVVFRTYFDDKLSECIVTKFRISDTLLFLDNFLLYLVKIRHIGSKCYMKKSY